MKWQENYNCDILDSQIKIDKLNQQFLNKKENDNKLMHLASDFTDGIMKFINQKFVVYVLPSMLRMPTSR